MTLSVQKNYPLLPAIVIELPHSSPGNSSYGSREDLEADGLGALSESIDGKFSTSVAPVSLRPGCFLSPKVSRNDSINSRSSFGKSRNSLDEQPAESAPNHGRSCRKSSLRSSCQSMSSNPAQSQLGSRSTCKDPPADCGLLGVPRTTRSLSHSHSLRSAISYKDRSTCFLYPGDMPRNYDLSSGGGLTAFGGSMACCGVHPNMDSSCIPYAHRHARCSQYHAHYPYQLVPNDNLSGSNLSQLSALEAMHETCGQMCVHTNMKGSRPDKPRKFKRSSLTPTYSSSDASSPQLSTHCLLTISPQTTHSNLSSSYPITAHTAIPSRLRRASSMSEYATASKPRRRSDTDCTRYGQLMNQHAISEPPKSRTRSTGHREHRHYSVSHAPCYAAHVHEKSPIPCYLGPANGLLSHSTPYSIRSPLSERRHTDGTDVQNYWLQPPVHSRRAQSFNCQALDELITQPRKNSTADFRRASAFVNGLHSAPRCACHGNMDDFPVRVPLCHEAGTGSVVGSETDMDTVKLWMDDEVDTRVDTQVFAQKPNSNGLCFCQLIVLLVSMQIVLGLAATGLGLYLRWRVPLLPTEECAFWAAIPICITGLIGTYFCLQQRISQTNPQVTLVIRRIAGTLSLVSCILCLVASIFSGQKGSLIATYGTACVTSSPLSTVGNSSTGSDVDTDAAAAADVDDGQQSANHALGFEQQCCIDGIGRNTEPVCQCFSVRNQLMWSYQSISCRYLFSSVKDYLILQSALMAVGTGVCLWFWVVLTEQFQPVREQQTTVEPNKKFSVSSVKNSFGETTITSYDGKRCHSESASESKSRRTSPTSTTALGSTNPPVTSPSAKPVQVTQTITTNHSNGSLVRDNKQSKSKRLNKLTQATPNDSEPDK